MDFATFFEMASQYIIVPLVIWALTELHRFVTAKVDGIKDENVRKALQGAYDTIDEAARMAVAEAEVKLVRIAKKHDRWDEAAQKEAKDYAYGIARRLIDDYSYALVHEATQNVNEYIKAKIEKVVQEG